VLQELGVLDAAAALASSMEPVKKPKKVKAAAAADNVERRVSAREKKPVNYSELESTTAREPRAPVDYSERIKVLLAGLQLQINSCAGPVSIIRAEAVAAAATNVCVTLPALPHRASHWTRRQQSSCARRQPARRLAAAAAAVAPRRRRVARHVALWTLARVCASRWVGCGQHLMMLKSASTNASSPACHPLKQQQWCVLTLLLLLVYMLLLPRRVGACTTPSTA
jgi:hypothetical protein